MSNDPPRLYCRVVTPFLEGSALGLLATGAAVGAAVVGVGSFLISRLRARRPWGAPVAGLAMAVPIALVATDGASLGLLGTAGLFLLLLSGVLVPGSRPALVHGLAAIPGASLMAFSTEGWGLVLVIVGAPIVVVAVASFESGHREQPALSAMGAAIAAGGAFLTVPDTEHVSLLAGAAVVVGLGALVHPPLTLGASGPVWAGAFMWSVAIDGSPRTTGIVGALGALGLLVVDPAVRVNLTIDRGLAMYLPATAPMSRLVQFAALQTALALFTSRIAGLRMDVLVAIALTVVAWSVAAYLLGRNARAISSAQGPV